MSRIICWIKGHVEEWREGGKPGTWWARWLQCIRCDRVRDYHYIGMPARFIPQPSPSEER